MKTVFLQSFIKRIVDIFFTIWKSLGVPRSPFERYNSGNHMYVAVQNSRRLLFFKPDKLEGAFQIKTLDESNWISFSINSHQYFLQRISRHNSELRLRGNKS